jgi:hypothetical protein
VNEKVEQGRDTNHASRYAARAYGSEEELLRVLFAALKGRSSTKEHSAAAHRLKISSENRMFPDAAFVKMSGWAVANVDVPGYVAEKAGLPELHNYCS